MSTLHDAQQRAAEAPGTVSVGRRALVALMTAGVLATAAMTGGCSPEKAATGSDEKAEPKPITITVAPSERAVVQRTVEVVGTLRGWEQVTIGSKQTGRVLRVLHDIGDRVKPGEALVELDPIDAKLTVNQKESQLLAELVKLGISREEAESILKQYGFTENILNNETVNAKIEQVPGVQQAKAEAEKKSTNLGRQRQLANRGAGTLQELQNAENDYESSRAAYENAKSTARTTVANALATKVALDQAKQVLDEMVVRAPNPSKVPEGYESEGEVAYAVTKREVSEGQLLRPADPVYDLVLEHPLRLWTNVPERFASEVGTGQEVRLSVASQPNEAFRGRVVRINPSVDPVSRTFQVETLVPNREGKLRPGGFAKAAVVTKEEDAALVVPIESIIRFAGVTKLFVFRPDSSKPDTGRAREVLVETRDLDASDNSALRNKIEVIGDLKEGDLVVSSGQTQLADGSPVVLRKIEPPKVEGEGKAAEGEAEGAGAEGGAAEAAPAKTNQKGSDRADG